MERKGLGIVQGDGHAHDGSPCLACGVPLRREDSICGSCGKSAPAAFAHSYFELLGLPERYAVEDALLAERFHAASRASHPDRFATASPTERRLAVQRTTLLNDAYRTLREPVKRAVYLLQRTGAWAGEHQGSRDPELLMEVMEGRERVHELRDELRAGAASAQASLRAFRREVDDKLGALHAALRAEFERYDGVAERGRALAALSGLVERLRYFENTKGQLEQLALQHPSGPSA